MQGALLEVVQRTDPGRDPDKQVNEDSAGHKVTPLGHLLVVCDGMGGHALGQEASRLAVSTIVQCLESAPAGAPPGPSLANAIAQAGRKVFDLGGAQAHAGRPGSTCVALLVHGNAVEVAHVGDSRAYFIRGGRIWPLTKDHSIVQKMVDQGALTPEQAAVHPEANKITRALGMKPDTDVELRDPPLLQAPGDIFILASDGLCDLVPTDEIGSVIVQAPTLDFGCQSLVAMANARGGHDNITVLVARVPVTGGSPMKISGEGLAPTIVQTVAGALPSGAPLASAAPPVAPPHASHPMPSGAPEKTLVDHALSAPPNTAPFMPHQPAIPFVPNTPAVPSPPLPVSGHPPGAHGYPGAPPVVPATIPPAPPSNSTVFALILGLVGLILAGVLVWAISRFH